MSNTPVTDELIDSFFKSDYFNFMNGAKPTIQAWEKFKSQHSSSGREGWEIIEIFYGDNRTKDALAIYDFKVRGSRYADWSIHSVRRLSDGEVFSIGDVLVNYGVIMSFKIQSGKDVLARCNDGQELLNHVFIEDCKKAPILQKPNPLFTTEDGVELFSRHDEVWGIDKKKLVRVTGNWNGIGTWLNGWYFIHQIPNPREKNPEVLKFIKENFAIFSTEQAANEYILMNKPCLSVNDVMTLDVDVQVDLKSRWPLLPAGPSNAIIFLPDSLKALAQSKINPLPSI